MKRRTEKGWAIVGDFGLYTGWWLTRRQAINEHCASRVVMGGPGDPRKRVWKQCQEDGDRAVRVTITYADPRP